MPPAHHPIFDHFTGFDGDVAAGFTVDFAGMLLEQRLLEPALQEVAPARHVQALAPVCRGDGYFDLIAVAAAVDRATDKFTMIEFGAGYGYWISEGGALARQRGLKLHLIGVEAEPGHFRLMQRHIANNHFDAEEATLIEAAVAPEDGIAYFETGKPYECWGQTLRPSQNAPTGFEGAVISPVRGISVSTVLGLVENVDVLHMDVQGVEADVLRPAFDVVATKVKSIIIGTHSKAIETDLRAMFSGWRPVFDFPIAETSVTAFGPVAFGDGLQVWENPRLI